MQDLITNLLIGLFIIMIVVVVVLSFVSHNNEIVYKVALITSLIGIMAVIFDEKRYRP